MTDEQLNRAMFDRDWAVRQLKIQHANLRVIKMALNDNRPLEALNTANNSLDELGETIDQLEEAEDLLQGEEGDQ